MRKFCTSSSEIARLWQRISYVILVLAMLSTNFGIALTPVQAAGFEQTPAPTATPNDQNKATPADAQADTPMPNSSGVSRNVLNTTPVTFTAGYVTINDNAPASPYPATITVQGVTNTIASATVNLYSLTHSYPDDIDMLLVGPGGQKTILLSDIGSGANRADYVDITLDDNAPGAVPYSGLVTGGYYKPTDGTSFNGTATDTFSSPAPSGPYSVTLSVFNNTLPNGDWKLYIMDDASGGAISFLGGWSITLYVLNVPNVQPSAGNNQSSWLNYPYSIPLQASVRDENGNPLSSKVVTFTAPATGASGKFANGSNVFTGTTNAAGLVTATTFTANSTAGSFAVNLQATGVTYNGSFALTNLSSGPPSTITTTNGNNQSALTNNAFAQNLAVTVKDSNSNLVSNAVITFTAPASGASGLFSNATNVYTTTTNSSGVATANTFTANGVTGSYNITATESKTGISTLFTLTNIALDAIQFQSSSYTVTENVGSAVMTVTRGSNNSNPIYASLTISNLTTSDIDYSPVYTGRLLNKSFDPGTGTGSGSISKAITLTDGKVLIAGGFSNYNNSSVTGVARLNANGSLDTSFQSTGSGTNSAVNGMARQSDGKIIIVGTDFSTYNGAARNRIARLNADGSLDTSFDPGSGPNNGVYRVAAQPDGKILIGGDFSSYRGVTRNRIARLNSDGSLDTSFAASGAGANSTVWSIALQPDGKILIGGSFTSYAGTTANRIARLNSDGSLDTSFTGQTLGANNVVWDFAVQSDGKIIAAGDFTTYNQAAVGYIVRLNSADGSRDTTFISGASGANGTIRALNYQSDGKLLFGGDFSTFNGSSLLRVGRLNADGTLDSSFTIGGSGPDSLVWTLAAFTNNTFIVGGDFTNYDGVSRNHIARAGGFQLYWPAGDATPKTFTLPIVNDNLPELNEQLTVSLTSVGAYGLIGSPATTTLTILDDDNTASIFTSGGGQSTLAGTAFSQPLVAVLQGNGQPIAGAVVTFTAPTTGASGTFAGGSNVFTGTTDVNGLITTTTFTANTTPGTYSVNATTFRAAGPGSFILTNNQNNSVINLLALSGDGQSAVVSTTFTNPLAVTVLNGYSQPVAGAVVTFTAPASGASGKFANGSNIFTGTTGANGAITTTLFTANGLVGSYPVVVTTTGAPAAVTFTLTNLTTGVPSTIVVISGNNQSSSVSTPFAQSLAVLVKDNTGTPVSNATITFTAPASGASGTFFNNSTVYTATTNSSGVATVTTFTANAIAGTYNVTATESRTSISTLFTLTNVAKDTIQFESSIFTTTEDVNFGSVFLTVTRIGNNGGEIYASLKVTNLTTSDADYFSPDGGRILDRSFDPGTGTNAYGVYKTIPLTDGKILVAGGFTSYNSIAVTGVARLNADGSLDTSFQSTGSGTDGGVNAMVRQPDGKIIIVGSTFSKYNGVARNRIARLNADGSLDTSFDPSVGPNNAIFQVAVQLDGKIIIGGDFISYGGVTRNRIARLNADGTLDTSFDPVVGASNTVRAIAVQPDGKILIGGVFGSYAGSTTKNIARLNADGTLDTSFTGQTLGANGAVWDFALQPDGKIIAAGDFTTYNQTSVGYIARLNAADGSLDTTFLGGGSGANLPIKTISLRSDGKLFLGGDFTTFNGNNLPRVARLNTDSTLDGSFTVGGSGPNNTVWTIAAYNNNAYVVGGDFTSYDGVSRNHIARGGGRQLYWPAGDTSPKTFNIQINNDNIPEPNEQLMVSLVSVSPYGALGAPATTTLTIVDDGDTANLLPISGGGQSTLAGTVFTQPLVVAVLVDNQPLAGAVVTFTAPATGASGKFANSSNIFTGTTDANGLITTTTFTANAIPGTYSVTATTLGAVAPVSFTLTNIQDRVVTRLQVLSGSGQSTLINTPFNFLLSVVAYNKDDQLVDGVVVTFTAPVTGASGTFVGGSNVFTGTTNTFGAVTSTPFTANGFIGSYQVVATVPSASASAIFTLTNLVNCTPLVVTAVTDDGAATTCGTFSYALTKAATGNTISFALSSGNIITFSGSLTPTVPAGVTIDGGVNGVVLNGNGVAGDGLRLAGNNTLSDLTVKSFGGREIVTLGTGNKLIRVRVVA